MRGEGGKREENDTGEGGERRNTTHRSRSSLTSFIISPIDTVTAPTKRESATSPATTVKSTQYVAASAGCALGLLHWKMRCVDS